MLRIVNGPLVAHPDDPDLLVQRYLIRVSGVPDRRLVFTDLDRLYRLGPCAWLEFPDLVRWDLHVYGLTFQLGDGLYKRSTVLGWMLSVDER